MFVLQLMFNALVNYYALGHKYNWEDMYIYPITKPTTMHFQQP